MKLSTRIENQTGIIELDGDFTFETQGAFRISSVAMLAIPNLQRMVLDLSRVSRMDASSLGALLILRESCQARNTSLALRNPPPQTLALLSLVHFEKLFELLP